MNAGSDAVPAQRDLDRRIAIILLLLAFCYLLLTHWTALHGQLVSDSLSLMRGCHARAEEGTLLAWLLQLWLDGLPVHSHYYRPLSSASLCLDYLLFADNAMAWHSMQLALHAGNGLLLFALAGLLSRGLRWRQSASALAVVLFFVSPAAPEVSVWIAGRYNVLALGWMLLAMLLHGHGRYHWSVLMTLLALASKESALVLPVLLASISWWRYALHDAPPPSLAARVRQSWLELWPTAVLVLAYLALRWHLFGDPLSVYAKSTSVADDFGWHWLQRVPVLLEILLPGWRDAPALQWLFVLSLTLAAGFGLWRLLFLRTAQQSIWIRTWLLPALWLSLALLALLPHVQTASSAGEGSRLMYNAGAWLALLLALPMAHADKAGLGKPLFGSPTVSAALHLGISMVVLLVLACSQYPAQRDWSQATVLVDKLRTELALKAAAMPPDHWALVLVPDHLGMALVARNAQGALVMPPLQQKTLLPQLLPFLYRDMKSWYQRLQQGERSWPQYAFCMHPYSGALMPLALPDAAVSLVDWEAFWRDVMASPPCHGIDMLRLPEPSTRS